MIKNKITIKNLADHKLHAILYCRGSQHCVKKKGIRFRRTFRVFPGHYELELYYKHYSAQVKRETIGIENTSVNSLAHGAYTRSRIVFKKLDKDYFIECDAKISVSDVLRK